MKAQELVDLEKEPLLSVDEWLDSARQLLTARARPVCVFGQRVNGDTRAWLILASPATAQLFLTSTLFAARSRQNYAALSYDIACANYFECELFEQTGIEPEKHPWLRPVRTGEAWRREGKP